MKSVPAIWTQAFQQPVMLHCVKKKKRHTYFNGNLIHCVNQLKINKVFLSYFLAKSVLSISCCSHQSRDLCIWRGSHWESWTDEWHCIMLSDDQCVWQCQGENNPVNVVEKHTSITPNITVLGDIGSDSGHLC